MSSKEWGEQIRGPVSRKKTRSLGRKRTGDLTFTGVVVHKKNRGVLGGGGDLYEGGTNQKGNPILAVEEREMEGCHSS